MFSKLRPTLPNLLHWATIFLFYYQPGVDREAVFRFVMESFPNFWLGLGGSASIVIASSWAVALAVFWVIYHIQHPLFEKYRVPDVWLWDSKKKGVADKQVSLIRQAAKKIPGDQIFTCGMLILFCWSQCKDLPPEAMEEYIQKTPPWYISALHIVLGLLMFETIFYWAHRGLHTVPSLYKHHKIHHEFHQPVSLTGTHGSQLDGLAALVFPGVFPAAVLGFHMYTAWMWSIIHIFHSVYDHCGYDFPWTPMDLIPMSGETRAHNFHHTKNVGNYGLYWRFWDTWMGTDKAWQKYVQEQEEAKAGKTVKAE